MAIAAEAKAFKQVTMFQIDPTTKASIEPTWNLLVDTRQDFTRARSISLRCSFDALLWLTIHTEYIDKFWKGLSKCKETA
jgi:hypothetical protein